MLASSSCVESLSFPAFADLSSIVNGTWAMSPMLPGYGVEKWEPMLLQVALWNQDYTGKALLLENSNKGTSPERTCRKALANGAKKGYGKPAMILQPSPSGVAGFGLMARDNSKMSDLNLPAVEVSLVFLLVVEELNKLDIPVFVIVRDDDKNPIMIEWPYSAVVISALVLSAICICCYVVNIYKFYRHVRITKGVTTAKVFFTLDIIANFMRFWWVCINPFYVNLFGYTWTTMCTTTHVALSIICTLLLALKWRELLHSTKLKVVLFLSTFRWPFIIASCIIFLVELISSCLRGLWFDIGKLSIASWSFLTVAIWIVVALLFLSGIQIMMQIQNAVGHRRNVLQLSTTTIFIMASGLFLLVWAITQMVFLIRTYKLKKISIKDPQIYNIVQLATLMIASFLQNWAMPIPINFSSSRKGSSRTVITATTKSKSLDGDDDTRNGTGQSSLHRHYSTIHTAITNNAPDSDNEEDSGKGSRDSAEVGKIADTIDSSSSDRELIPAYKNGKPIVAPVPKDPENPSSSDSEDDESDDE